MLLMFGFIGAGSLRLHAEGTDSLDAEKRYSRAELVADVHTLTGYLEEVHPNMYHNISRKKYARLKQKSLAALHDGMSLQEAWLQLGPLLGALGEGHSYLDFPATAVAQIKTAPGAIFPLTFQSFDGKGKVVMLIGTHTFSSANMLANAIGDYQLATLVGQPTGEPANDYGEIIQLELPNTKLGFTTATKQFIRANGDARSILPVMPDITVSDNPATPEDEVLEAAVRLH